VAGATLMAAGGSAPELATSLIGNTVACPRGCWRPNLCVWVCIGTFQRSDIGFGTIVGSAVFNVLFVIGMCVLFTPAEFAPLRLTWWPLARDCSFYVLTLATLVLFMWDGKVRH
jgi:sodium/potassium/calcium exchanger 2